MQVNYVPLKLAYNLCHYAKRRTCELLLPKWHRLFRIWRCCLHRLYCKSRNIDLQENWANLAMGQNLNYHSNLTKKLKFTAAKLSWFTVFSQSWCHTNRWISGTTFLLHVCMFGMTMTQPIRALFAWRRSCLCCWCNSTLNAKWPGWEILMFMYWLNHIKSGTHCRMWRG